MATWTVGGCLACEPAARGQLSGWEADLAICRLTAFCQTQLLLDFSPPEMERRALRSPLPKEDSPLPPMLSADALWRRPSACKPAALSVPQGQSLEKDVV